MIQQQLIENWKVVKFGDIAEHISERVNPKVGDEKKYIGLEHLDSGSLKVKRWGSNVILKGQKLAMKKGDILFAKRNAYLKRVAIAPFSGIFSAHGMVMRPKSEHIVEELLPFIMQSNVFMNRAVAISEGSLSPTIKWKTLSRQEFCLPSEKSLQLKLLGLCLKTESVYEQIVDLKEVLATLEKTFRASCRGSQEWDEFKLGELSEYITSGSRGWSKYFGSEGALFLRSQNIRDGYLDLDDKVYVCLPDKVEGKRTKLCSEDIVFTITGNSVGNVSLIEEGVGEVYVSQHVALVRLLNTTYSKFIAYYFSKGAPGNREIQLCQYGQSKPGLNLKNISNFKVKLPPENELKNYVKIIEDISAVKTLLDIKIENFNSLKNIVNSSLVKEA
ncbi:restriction endonuclease subunit S [Photobacterium sanguinicancri]|uniref:restriction endonuclease subunit S n=1 Tax=Photobacterium sanguinicancri TaxID=875932 RepID=UPI0021C3EBE5|nr:restriction endonuclease subunit S [Photobacterium sanguinicancri]